MNKVKTKQLTTFATFPVYKDLIVSSVHPTVSGLSSLYTSGGVFLGPALLPASVYPHLSALQLGAGKTKVGKNKLVISNLVG